jgi:integrase
MPRPRLDGTPAAEPNRRRLTDVFLNSLKPRERPFAVWDSKQKGLAVSVQPSGSKSWKVVYHHHGRPRWYTIGSASAIGLADARKLASRVMFAVAEGKDPQAERKAARSAGTFEELATRYVEEYAKKNNRSWRQADSLVRSNVLPRWAKLRAGDITKADVKAMFSRIAAPITANQTLAATSAIFSWALREEVGQITVNPCALVERNPTRERERVLSDSEVPLFWEAFAGAGLLRATALRLILLTGQRPGEVCHMRREHISDGWWTLPGAPVKALAWPGTKNGDSHRVWLSEPVRDLIDDLDTTSGPVFPKVRKLAEDMRAICRQLGVAEKVTPHDLRRTFCSRVTGLGFGRDAMNRVTNHKEGGIADTYDRHQYATENQKVMESVAGAIMSLVDGGAKRNVVQGKFKR